MEAFDAQLGNIEKLFRYGSPNEALRAALHACHHAGPEPEPPGFRDARAAMLARVLMRKIFIGAGEKVLQSPECGLLNRRIFNFLYGRCIEVKIFPVICGRRIRSRLRRRNATSL
jgi:hypothetical protein